MSNKQKEKVTIPKDLLDLAEIKIKLEEKLDIDVDLLTYRSLRPRFKRKIKQDLVSAYE